ncbi:MAG: ectonucleotide pyrophosphatase/phosphodiesterase [Candidatus Egerieousia sp.]|nr:ectonucleotide pyrophosphatase/phosphodiesterase [bacterium]MDY5255300.1 ectonucleotide pyrophosphatase/phosphodiesterase [Candidatus Egerieousia sp.]
MATKFKNIIGLTLCLITFAITINSCCGEGQQKRNLTIVVSLDAFRWDYPTIYNTPWLDSIAANGVAATMVPSYPSSTVPNHFTLATGLVPDHHGIVNSQFWAPEKGELFSMGDSATRYNPYYFGGEPIWVTAKKQGVKSASIYWVGSDVAIQGLYPDYYLRWDNEPRLTYPQRVDEALRIAKLPESERPSLLMVYFDEPDWTTHHYGPIAEESEAVIEQLDSLMGILYRGLKELDYGVNLIVTSDHGMTDISDDRFISIEQSVNPDWVERIVSTNPTSIFCKEGCRDSLFEQLSKVKHISVWRKEEVPAHLNYGSSNHLGDLIVAPDLGWQFATTPRGLNGAHGYDINEPDMQIIFRACGPDFKRGYTLPHSFSNVDLYSILAELLKIEPAKTDGSLEKVQELFSK